MTDSVTVKDPSGTLSMTADCHTGRLQVLDALTGYTWNSNIPKDAEDPVAFGDNQKRVHSTLIITYQKENNVTLMELPDALSRDEGGCTVDAYLNGNVLTMVYRFSELGFTIPVRYSLQDRQLRAAVAAKDIEETGPNKLVGLSMLPFMGAGQTNERGYILIPDGSGALIHFNNGKTRGGRLTLDTQYGNRGVSPVRRQPETQPVLLPCFGLVHELHNSGTAGQAGMLAFATQGSFAGQINTNVAGKETGQNYAYFTFYYRENMVETLLDRTWLARTRLVCDTKPSGSETYEMNYRFTVPDQDGLQGLSALCRNILFGDQPEPDAVKEIPMFLQMYMGVRVRENFLGIPYYNVRALTTFAQAGEISSQLRQEGIPEIIMQLRGISSNGDYYGKINRTFQADGALGGNKGFLKLQALKHTQVYPEEELTSFTRGGNGVSKVKDSATNLIMDTITHSTFELASGMPSATLSKWNLLKPQSVLSSAGSLVKSMNKIGVKNISASSLGKAPYGDYTRSGATRIQETGELLIAAAEKLKDRGGLMLEAPFAGMIPYADVLTNIPLESSHYNISDAEVPFLQMILSGHVQYAAPPVNLTGDAEEVLLRSIEAGSPLSFSLMWEPYEKAAGTSLNHLYGSQYSQQKDAAVDLYKRNAQALQDVYGETIVDYRFYEPDLRVITYSNKYRIVVNLGYADAVWQGRNVKARSYLRVKED